MPVVKKRIIPPLKSDGKLGRGLARPSDPLVLHTGETIEPDTGPRDVPAALNKMISPVDFRPMRKRTLRELPAGVGVLNACSAVYMYTMLGLTDREIADSLKITVIEVDEVRHMPAYAELFENVLTELINTSSEMLTTRIAAMAHVALDTVSSIAVNGKQEMNRLKASQDLLDRGGVRIKGADERKQSGMSELRIIMIDDTKRVEVDIKGM